MIALSSTKVHFCWAGVAVLVAALGCGGSTDTQTGTTGASGGSGGSGGSSGSGGSGGSGGSTTGGTGGSSGGTPDATVQPDGGDVICNGMVCPSTTFGMTIVPACCTAQNTCGFSFSIGGQPGMCFDPPSADAGGSRPETGVGVPDPSCASLTLLGFLLPGCCMPDNTCGFSSQVSGCVSIDYLRSLNLPGVNLPEGGPMSCQYPPP